MSPTNQKIFIWSGTFSLVVLCVGFLVSGFLPPPGVHDSAAKIAHFYSVHPDAIKGGLVISMFGVAFLGPWVAMIAYHLRRIEGPGSPSAYLQIGLGTLLVIEFLVPMIMLEAAAFRPDRAASSIQSLNDEGWLGIVSVVSTAVVELIALGLAVRSDRRDDPIFPKWLSPVSIVVGLIFALGGFCVFAHTGPFAWSGVLSFWIPLAAFGIWIVLMCVLMHRAVNRAGTDSQVAAATGSPGADVTELAAEVAVLRHEVASLRSAQPEPR